MGFEVVEVVVGTVADLGIETDRRGLDPDPAVEVAEGIVVDQALGLVGFQIG